MIYELVRLVYLSVPNIVYGIGTIGTMRQNVLLFPISCRNMDNCSIWPGIVFYDSQRDRLLCVRQHKYRMVHHSLLLFSMFYKEMIFQEQHFQNSIVYNFSIWFVWKLLMDLAIVVLASIITHLSWHIL